MKLHTLIFLLGLFIIASCDDGTVDPEPDPTKEENFVFDATPADRPIDISPDDWVLDGDLSDQFNAASLHTSKWNNNPNDWGPWSWEANNAFVENEELTLRLRYEPHTDRNMDMFYKSGIIRSLDTLTYGYVEAKIKGIDVYPAASPAFWLYSLGSELTAWGYKKNEEGSTHYAEVDVVEMLQGEWDPNAQPGNQWDDRFPPNMMDHNLHTIVYENGQTVSKRPGSHPHLTDNVYDAPWDPRDDYHTYGALIAPDKVTWFVDGVKIAEKDNLHWHVPMHVTLSLGLRYPHVTYHGCPNGLDRCPVPSAATEDGFPTNMQVDWVRCYRRK